MDLIQAQEQAHTSALNAIPSTGSLGAMMANSNAQALNQSSFVKQGSMLQFELSMDY